MTKIYKSLSDLQYRKSRLFISAEKAFELLVFEYEYTKQIFYLKYFQDDFFTELSGGYNTQSGKFNKGIGLNPWVDNYEQNIEIYNNSSDIMIKDSIFQMYFLKEVTEDFDKIFDFQYLELPRDVINISYSYQTLDFIPVYFLIYYPTYYFGYDTQKAFAIKEGVIEELNITDFQRYRDGGTTIIDIEDYDKGFYFPTAFNQQLKATFNGHVIIPTLETNTKILVDLLKLELNVK